jgi:hypothetical protein
MARKQGELTLVNHFSDFADFQAAVKELNPGSTSRGFNRRPSSTSLSRRTKHLCEYFGDRRSAMGNGDGPAGQVGKHHLRIDAQKMVHRGDQVAR